MVYGRVQSCGFAPHINFNNTLNWFAEIPMLTVQSYVYSPSSAASRDLDHRQYISGDISALNNSNQPCRSDNYRLRALLVGVVSSVLRTILTRRLTFVSWLIRHHSSQATPLYPLCHEESLPSDCLYRLDTIKWAMALEQTVPPLPLPVLFFPLLLRLPKNCGLFPLDLR